MKELRPPRKEALKVAEKFRRLLVRRPNGCIEFTGYIYPNGYGTIECDRVRFRVHRLAWELKHGEIESTQHVLHSCHNRSCCNTDHLRIGTHADNMRDRDKSRRLAFGERHGSAKLGESDVRRIYREHKSGQSGLKELADKNGVSPRAIYAIVNRETWRHVDMSEKCHE